MTSFESVYKAAEKQLQEQLSASEFWHLVAPGQANATNPDILGVLQSSTGLFYTTEQLKQFMEANPFIGIWHENEKQDVVLESATKLLWSNCEAKIEAFLTINNIEPILKKIKNLGLNNWQLPELEQLKKFAMRSNNPFRKGDKYLLLRSDLNEEHWFWLCTQGRVTLFDENWIVSKNDAGYLFSKQKFFSKSDYQEVAKKLLDKNWQFKSFDDKNVLTTGQIHADDLLFTIGQLGFDLIPVNKKESLSSIKIAELLSIDKLPELD